jgi:hypothetical protein
MVTFASGKPSKSSLASHTLVFIALTVPVNGSDFISFYWFLVCFGRFIAHWLPSLRLSRWSHLTPLPTPFASGEIGLSPFLERSSFFVRVGENFCGVVEVIKLDLPESVCGLLSQ